MRWRARTGVACLVLTAASFGGTLAWATLTSTAQAQLQTATATLLPPGSVTASALCPNKKAGHVLVSWAASPSAFTAGYVVTRATGTGTPSVVAMLGATATSYDDTAIAGNTTYTYAVTATFLGWSSVAASTIVTTPRRC